MRGSATFVCYTNNYRTEFEYVGKPPEIQDQRVWIIGNNDQEVEIHHPAIFDKSQGSVFKAIKAAEEDEKAWPLYQAGGAV